MNWKLPHMARALLTLDAIVISVLAFTPLELPAVVSLNDKISHALAFLSLAFLSDYSFPNQRYRRIAMACMLYGISIELIQIFIPNRLFSLADIVADGVGLAIYPLFWPILRKMPFLSNRFNTADQSQHR